ncbi:MAG: lysophospholipid acyltransferase family protein [Gammaproteobacteria bacterium]|nr:lysophospholipid acyltransferase family protein [Gammaproteobacteria bacterium]
MPVAHNRNDASSESFHAGFLKPGYWGTWSLLVVLWLVMWLPRKWVMAIGGCYGDQMRKRNSKRRKIAETNLRLCFPELDDDQRQAMLKDHFRCYGQGLMDMGLAMMGTKNRIGKFTSVQGMENLSGLPGTQKTILITYHTTTLDMFPMSFMTGIDLVSMMKRDHNPVLNWFLYRSRMRHRKVKVYMRDQGLRRILDGMNEGRACFLVPDEDLGAGKHTVFAPFFGQDRSTLNTVGRLARITDAVVIPGICRLIPETGCYVTTLLPPLDDFPTGDQVRDASIMSEAMEKLIHQAPEQYLWTFRWFQTRPAGMESPYD